MLTFRDQDEERRKRYFGECDRILREFRQGDTEPPDAFVVKMLALTVEEERTFTSFIEKRQIADPDWKKLREVCAAMFFEAYIRAVEDGSWPEN
jgi:hypothetical protein